MGPGVAADSRIGIFGGTFDPIHLGHVGAARAARDAVRLDLVLFVPAARPRLRREAPAASIEHRLAMVRLAIDGLAWADISTVDAERPGPAYSVDTVRDVRRQYGGGPDLFLIVGADAIAGLPEWKDPEDLIRIASLVCVGRPGQARPESLSDRHPGHGAIYVESAMSEVSATEVRQRVAEGLPVTGMVPDAVARYIEVHGLYRRCRNSVDTIS